MINLLPPEYKQQVRAGQSNTLLLRYCIISMALALLLLGSGGAIYLIMNMFKSQAQSTIEYAKNQSAAYAESQQKADVFKNNLTLAKTILEKEVRYSNIILKIAQVLPNGVVLSSIQLDAKTFGKKTSLNALGRSYNDAIRLKTAFEKSPYFSDVRLSSVTENEDDNSGYSHLINIEVTISPEIAKS